MPTTEVALSLDHPVDERAIRRWDREGERRSLVVLSRFEVLGHGRELAVEREMGKSRNSASSGMVRKGRFSSASTTLPISLIVPVGRIRGVVVIADMGPR